MQKDCKGMQNNYKEKGMTTNSQKKKQLVPNWQQSVAKCQQSVAKLKIATWNDYKRGFILGVLLLLEGWRA